MCLSILLAMIRNHRPWHRNKKLCPDQMIIADVRGLGMRGEVGICTKGRTRRSREGKAISPPDNLPNRPCQFTATISDSSARAFNSSRKSVSSLRLMNSYHEFAYALRSWENGSESKRVIGKCTNVAFEQVRKSHGYSSTRCWPMALFVPTRSTA